MLLLFKTNLKFNINPLFHNFHLQCFRLKIRTSNTKEKPNTHMINSILLKLNNISNYKKLVNNRLHLNLKCTTTYLLILTLIHIKRLRYHIPNKLKQTKAN